MFIELERKSPNIEQKHRRGRNNPSFTKVFMEGTAYSCVTNFMFTILVPLDFPIFFGDCCVWDIYHVDMDLYDIMNYNIMNYN